MPIQSYDSDLLSIKDVVSSELVPFSRSTVKVTPAVNLVPGSVIDSSGALVSSASTSAFVSLEYASSGVETNLLIAGTNVFLKAFSLVADDLDKAKSLLSADKTVRFSDYAELPTT